MITSTSFLAFWNVIPANLLYYNPCKPESLGGPVFWLRRIFSSKKKTPPFSTQVIGRFEDSKPPWTYIAQMMKQWGTEASFDSPWADRSAVSKTWRISSCFQHPRFYNPMGALKRYQYQKERKVVLQPSFFKDCWWKCGADLKVWAWFENMEYFTSRFLLRFKNAMKLPMLHAARCRCNVIHGLRGKQCGTINGF